MNSNINKHTLKCSNVTGVSGLFFLICTSSKNISLYNSILYEYQYEYKSTCYDILLFHQTETWTRLFH